MKHFSSQTKNALLSLIVATGALLASCGPAKDIAYMQDLPDNAVLTLQENGELRLQPGDKLRIKVHSRDEEMVKIGRASCRERV